MNKEQQIEEIAEILKNSTTESAKYFQAEVKKAFRNGAKNLKRSDCKKSIHDIAAEALYNAGYRKIPEDSVVLSREEYEKLKSLYDTQKGAIMTSKIGDLPLTVAGLRKAVDEITRLNTIEAELQELNIKYYNEAKDLRRQLADTEADNKRLSAKLGQILLSIDTVKEMNAMCNIDEQRKQAVKEFAERLKNEVYPFLQAEMYNKKYCITGNIESDICREHQNQNIGILKAQDVLSKWFKVKIDELLNEYENEKCF